jgi:geranylgeranyl pyrophosphate synthase
MAEVVPASAVELLTEARDATDTLLERWASRLEASLAAPEGAALAYALRSPGKRVRAALVLAAFRSTGGNGAGAVGVGAAVETVHAYSLVHDDLPCMDDDDLRRGRPTTHRQFGVPAATRAGYLLVPVAAQVLAEGARNLGLDAAGLGRMATELFQAGGIEGMVGGQWLDLAAEGRLLELPELMSVHRGKTGALIRAACTLGGLAARAEHHAVAALAGYGEEIGLAFQIADDVLDATATSVQLGKTAGRDATLAKSTYVRVLGIDGAREEAIRLARRAVAHLEKTGVPTGSLGALAEYIVTRSS